MHQPKLDILCETMDLSDQFIDVKYTVNFLSWNTLNVQHYRPFKNHSWNNYRNFLISSPGNQFQVGGLVFRRNTNFQLEEVFTSEIIMFYRIQEMSLKCRYNTAQSLPHTNKVGSRLFTPHDNKNFNGFAINIPSKWGPRTGFTV